MKEDQIREVMWLVRQYGDKNYLQGGADALDRELSSKNLDDEIRGKVLAIDTKLRELLPVWQPIESCLDDDWVIVWMPADEAQVIAQRSEGNWFGDDGLLHEDPTLWMPLPKAPE